MVAKTTKTKKAKPTAEPLTVSELQAERFFNGLTQEISEIEEVTEMQTFIAQLREVDGLASAKLSELITKEGAPK